MKFSQVLASACLLVLLPVTTTVNADLVISVTGNVTSGGTNWSFSDGSGTASGSGEHFLVGATAANPQPFHSSNDEDTDGLTVLAGSNVFNISNIFVRNYGGLSGTNGDIFDGIDIQTDGTTIGGLPIDSFDGLVLHAEDLDISSLNEGVYTLDSYYSGYDTELGTVTLNVDSSPIPAAPVPAMSTWGLVMLIGLLFMVGVRRRIV